MQGDDHLATQLRNVSNQVMAAFSTNMSNAKFDILWRECVTILSGFGENEEELNEFKDGMSLDSHSPLLTV